MSGRGPGWPQGDRLLIPRDMQRMRVGSRESLVVVLLLALAGCVRNPATGEKQLSLISEQQEIELGQQARKEVLQTMPLVDDAGLQSYVSQVGMRLAKASERPNLPWSFQVIDDASVNAFALPGGPIFVTRGLITHVTNEAELASVLGHEIGHVTARHSVSRMSQQQLAQVGLGIGGVLLPDKLKGLGQLASVGASLLFLKYSRDDESEADRLGFRYALGQHYDVRQMENLFQMLDQVGAKEQGRLPDWLATHPAPEDRAKATEAMLQKAAPLDFSALAVRRPEYLSHVDGLVFGQNPRDGLFRGNTFYAPELKFQWQLPEGWKAVNQPQAVISGSPQQDAILQLQGAGQLSPEEAARKFFSLKGVQQVGSAGPIPGHEGIEGHFQAQTEQGVVAGIVAFLPHEGRTYQIVGYTVAERLPSYDPVFRASIESFRPLTDPAILEVQPARVHVVKAEEKVSVPEAYKEEPQTVPLETFSVINGFAPTAQVPSGTALKVVTGGKPVETSTGAE